MLAPNMKHVLKTACFNQTVMNIFTLLLVLLQLPSLPESIMESAETKLWNT
jgi:hypothetical protein